MKSHYRILIAPLDWGLGHASRCIPIIQELLALKATPVLAGDGESLELLRVQFPHLECLNLTGMEITYPKNTTFFIHFLRQFKKMKKKIRDEHDELQKIIEDAQIDAVISDNRYGLYAHQIPSVLITHQLNPKTGFLNFMVSPFVKRLINRFDQCWVPDHEYGHTLAGDLSNAERSGLSHLTYVGPLSRFVPQKVLIEKDIDVLAILSGPEPHRTDLEEALILQLQEIEGSHVIVRGRSVRSGIDTKGSTKVTLIDLADQTTLQELIMRSKYLVSRSGYSSIMDYYALGRPALLIPTQGQPEQVYLAKHHSSSSFFVVQNESELNLSAALNEWPLKGPSEAKKSQRLKQTLADFLDSIY